MTRLDKGGSFEAHIDYSHQHLYDALGGSVRDDDHIPLL
jgi:hypothetical protein